MKKQFKYFAFISYSSHDTAWGKRLQRKLEGYRMPAALCSEHGWKRKPIDPVFFAPYDIKPGGLTAELQDRLEASRHLIVLCSPHSARSEWVGREIAYFHSLGRTEHIHFFIIDGVPHSGDPRTECFHPVVRELGIPEILGANVHEKVFRWPWLNRERAYVQLITKLLGLEFDSLWRRHQRLLRQKMAACTLGILAVLAALWGVWLNSRPVDVCVTLSEATAHNPRLPALREAVVTLQLGHEVKTDTLRTFSDHALFLHIPHNYLNKPVRLTVACRDWLPVDTTLELRRALTLPLARNPHAYGDVSMLLWDKNKEAGVPHTEISLAGQTATTDAAGYARVCIPLQQQCSIYHVQCPLPLENYMLPPASEPIALIVK